MNNIDQLIKMANSIGDFFEALPDRDEALYSIADHIKKFWEPSMRTAMLEFLEQHPDGRTEGAELSELVKQSILSNRGMLKPKVMG